MPLFIAEYYFSLFYYYLVSVLRKIRLFCTTIYISSFSYSN